MMGMRLGRAVLVAGVTAALAACGSGSSGGSGSDPGAGPEASLNIEVRAKPGADPKLATLECGEGANSSGFIDDADRACRAVEASRSLLINGPPDNIMCTEIYGGPHQATISGTLGGKSVRLDVSREDGCAIAVWDELEPLLGKP
jgi:hypothetical protein